MFKLRSIKEQPAKRIVAEPEQSQDHTSLAQLCSHLTEAIDGFVESRAILDDELSAAICSASSAETSPAASLAADTAWLARTAGDELALVIVKTSPANHLEAQARVDALFAYVTTSDFDEHIQSICCDALAMERIISGKNAKLLRYFSLAEAIKLWLHAERLPTKQRYAVVSHEPVRHPDPLA